MDEHPIDDYPCWSESMRMGHDSVDNDHKKIIDTLVALMGATAPTHAELVDLVAIFVEHTTEHFSREEALMRTCGYPGLDEHKAAHRNIQEVFITKLRPFIQGNIPHHEATRLFMWLFYDHLKLHDARLVTFLKDQGGLK
jgi:hemerythrin-like metal-binding protein